MNGERWEMSADPLLSLFGENLTEKLLMGGTSETDIVTQSNIKAYGWPLSNYILRLLNIKSPMYFVSEDDDFLRRYIQALVLVVGHPHQYDTLIQKYPLWGPVQLWNKQFHSLDMQKILAYVHQNDVLWDEILAYLSSETISDNYIFVI